MEAPPFTGFSEAGIRFLDELASNNNRDWFNANKSTFVENLQTPAVSFVAALGNKLKKISAGIVYDTRTNGAGSLMRIYRDTRFSADKTPYKTNVSMQIWEGPSKKAQYSGFYLRIETSGVGLFVGRHGFDKDDLAAYRDAVVDDRLGHDLEAVIEQVRGAGDYTIGGEHYKRVPRGFDSEHPRSDLLRYNGLYAFAPPVAPEHLTSPKLVDICFQHFEKMAPIHHWLVNVHQK